MRLALLILCVILAACTPATATPVPVTMTPSVTATWTPTASATATTTPTTTPTMTATPKPAPTCAPVTGDVTLHTWTDTNGDGLRQMLEPAMPDVCVLLTYTGLTVGNTYTVIEELCTGATGIAVTTLLAGAWLAHVQSFPQVGWPLVAPAFDNPGVWVISVGNEHVFLWRFDDYRPTPAAHTRTPTPPLVRTATVTPTPNLTPHGCAIVNCKPRDEGCGARGVDTAGQCSPGWVCCLP